MQWCFVLDALMLVCFEKGADKLMQGVDTIKVIFFYKWMEFKIVSSYVLQHSIF